MSSFKGLNINLNQDVYYPGELVSGSLTFNLNNYVMIYSVKISLIGDSKIHVSNFGNYKTKRKRLELYPSATENHIKMQTNLLTKPINQDFVLDKGGHSYNFQFLLPKTLPTSFEHPNGRIRYRIKVEIEFPMSTTDVFFKPFSILNLVDLNGITSLKNPCSAKIYKPIKSCFCKANGNVYLTFNTLQGGFVPGQSILFSLLIQNNTSKDLQNIFIQLIQQTQIANRLSTRIVSSYKLPKIITRQTTEIFDNGSLKVEPVCPNFSENLIKLGYFIYINMKPTKKKIKIEPNTVRIPIFIGTSPFIENRRNSSYNSIQYEPCIFGSHVEKTKVSKQQRESIEDFRPLYIYHENNGLQVEYVMGPKSF